MDKRIYNPVIMAGGVGSRLWPLSRKDFPKQFQSLVPDDSNRSMLQQAISRLFELQISHGQLICNQDHRFLAAEQVRQLATENPSLPIELNGNFDLVLEPCGRNTAPAVLVAALRLLAINNDYPMLVLAADHSIDRVKDFQTSLVQAYDMAEQGFIVTLGVEPTFPSSGYGYILRGPKVEYGHKVSKFVEKPSIEVAKRYLDSGAYLWNSGMFIVKPSTLLVEGDKYCPDLVRLCKKVVRNISLDLDFTRLPHEYFADCTDISLDYAIMEHTAKACVLEIDCGWSDVGDLEALKRVNSADDNNNVMIGDVSVLDASNCLVHANDRLVVALGVDNLAIVETKDAVLVSCLEKSQKVKNLLEHLSPRTELVSHREVFRPWGSYDSIDDGSNYQVKRISVAPGAKLSLQRHQYRAEHWVVVKGTAAVHLDGKEYSLKANDSIYIPRTSIHSLANNTNDLLVLIEVQSGSYLGEDDIERLEDVYGRTNKE